MKFTVEIRMESGMQTPEDVAIALMAIARRVTDQGMPVMPDGIVRDSQGNTVGHYCLTA